MCRCANSGVDFSRSFFFWKRGGKFFLQESISDRLRERNANRVPQNVEEIAEVVPLIPQERFQQRTVDPQSQAQKQFVAVVKVFPQERIADRLGERNFDDRVPRRVE